MRRCSLIYLIFMSASHIINHYWCRSIPWAWINLFLFPADCSQSYGIQYQHNRPFIYLFIHTWLITGRVHSRTHSPIYLFIHSQCPRFRICDHAPIHGRIYSFIYFIDWQHYMHWRMACHHLVAHLFIYLIDHSCIHELMHSSIPGAVIYLFIYLFI